MTAIPPSGAWRGPSPKRKEVPRPMQTDPTHSRSPASHERPGIAPAVPELLRRMGASVPGLVHLYEPSSGRTLYRNPSCRELLDDRGAETPRADAAHPWVALVRPGHRSRFARRIRDLSRADGPEGFEDHFTLDGHGGHAVRLQVWGTRFAISRRPPAILLTALDVTHRWNLERHLETVEADSRRELSREIHDGLSQELVGAQLLVGRARLALEDPATLAEILEELDDTVNECLARTRAMARGLDPLDLNARGLAAALRELAARAESRFRIPCSTNLDAPVEDLSELHDNDIRQIYWIAHEATLNAARHSGGQQVTLALSSDDEGFHVRITDDGRGFDPDHPANGMGLAVMRHRAELIDAELQIRSRPGRPTEVRVDVPRRRGTLHDGDRRGEDR